MSQTTAEESQRFSNHGPIASVQEDLFDRNEFAKRVAQSIWANTQKNSLTLAIYGAWGTGKTSLKNLIVSHIRTHSKETKIIEFSPWEFASQKEILTAFFNEIALVLGRRNSTDDDKKLALSFKKYASALLVGGVASSGLFRLFSKLSGVGLVLLSILTLLGYANVFTNTFFQSLEITIAIFTFLFGVVLAIIGFVSKLSQAIAEFYQSRADANKETIVELKHRLDKLLTQQKNSLIIVLDDLDRLTPSELATTIQLIKANTDLPHIIFLLLFDQQYVEQNLGRLYHIDGHDFLKKIVNIGFTIPNLDPLQIERVFHSYVRTHLQEDSAFIEDEYWRLVYQVASKAYLHNPRSVFRFIDSFSFHVAAFKDGKNLRVDIIDLAIIELLRLFEPAVYHLIPLNKDILTRSFAYFSSNKNQDEQAIKRLGAIFENARDKQATKELMCFAFPRITRWAFKDAKYKNQRKYFRFTAANSTNRRIQQPRFFERYFWFTSTENQLKEKELDHLIDSSTDIEKTLEILRSFKQYMDKLYITYDCVFEIWDKLPRASQDNIVQATFILMEEDENIIQSEPISRFLYDVLLTRQQPGEEPLEIRTFLSMSQSVEPLLYLSNSIHSRRNAILAKVIDEIIKDRVDSLSDEEIANSAHLPLFLKKLADVESTQLVYELLKRTLSAPGIAYHFVDTYVVGPFYGEIWYDSIRVEDEDGVSWLINGLIKETLTPEERKLLASQLDNNKELHKINDATLIKSKLWALLAFLQGASPKE